MVELNSNILKTIHILQAELKIFREDSLNERKEQQSINEALPTQGKPTQSTKISKREPYHKWASNTRDEEKQGRTPEASQ